jgi:radical SAM superfamily enzyme YgiQ (UPF0313 family)
MLGLKKSARILLLKPCAEAPSLSMQPPLGILYLAAGLRREFGSAVEVEYRDLRLDLERGEDFAKKMSADWDLIGISALNQEGLATLALAEAVKKRCPGAIVAVGGPHARSETQHLAASGAVDWIFRGESDRTFPRAVREWFFGERRLDGIPGLTWRSGEAGPFIDNPGEDSIADLDALAMPAWDLVPFDKYAARLNMNHSLRAKRYAPIFTSRGCPFRCNYCHDIFGKGFRWRSPDSVLAEIELLVDTYGVGEFEIVDDIYNLHRPRMRDIAKRVIARFGRRKLHFCFPNGVRADVIDTADLPLLRDMGVYDMSIAVETVSPRLQKLIDKNLDLARTERVIAAADRAGITTKGFFMLGFPTETADEIEATIRFAAESRLTMAHFFFVVPQRGTPLWDLARRESASAVDKVAVQDYYGVEPWYELAYGVDMNRVLSRALMRFYLRPWRIPANIRRTNLVNLARGGVRLLQMSSRSLVSSPGVALATPSNC